MKMDPTMKSNLNSEFNSINNELEKMKNDLDSELVKCSSSTVLVTTISDINK